MIKKWLAPALKIAVSVALIWLVLRSLDLQEVWMRVKGVPLWVLLGVASLFILQVGVCAFRWLAVLNAIGKPIPYWQAFNVFWIGTFFNQALPSSVGGDAVRIYRVYKSGQTFGTAFNGVMLERAATVLGLVLVVTVTLPMFYGRVDAQTGSWVVVGVLSLLAIALAGLGVVMCLDRIPAGLRKWRVVVGLAGLAADARLVFLRPLHTARVLAWACLGHANVTLAAYLLAAGLGMDVSYMDCLTFIPLVLLATTVPISIAGWGVREVSMVAAFGLVGVNPESATVLSLLFGFIVAATALPGGVLWLMHPDRKLDKSDVAVNS